MRLSPDDLVRALDALGVPFLIGSAPNGNATLSNNELLKALAGAPEARLRAAIIPLLLRRPEFADMARSAAKELPDTPRQTLQCFYTAAVLLQRKYAEQLSRLLGPQPELPDLFSVDLQLTLDHDVDASLQELGARHMALSGLQVNWVGTYEHAAERFIKYLENQARWDEPREESLSHLR